MSDTKHTSGPWLVADRTHVYTAGLQLVAVVQHSRESEADARLIAAAPCLLAALQAIAEGCSFPEDDVQRAVRDRARSAIAKATGGTNE